MTVIRKLHRFHRTLTVNGVDVDIAGLRRDGTRTPIVLLHGFGSTKEDYADIIQRPELGDHPVLTYDAPGCGATASSDLGANTIDFLLATAEQLLDAEGIGRFHLVGHSMGGLTALLLAHRRPDRVASFTNIEGNAAPEDCFLSRQILTHPGETPDAFLADFRDRAADSRFFSSALYSASLTHKVRADAVRPIFTSVVEYSDTQPILDWFTALRAPTMFVHGSQNHLLSYLRTLAAAGVEIAEISQSGHFPMYSNPPEFWDRLTRFLVTAEEAARELSGPSTLNIDEPG